MTDKLKRWGDEKPKAGVFIVLYPLNETSGTVCRTWRCNRSLEVLLRGPKPGSNLHPTPRSSDRWCEVTGPPDWSSILNEARVEELTKQRKKNAVTIASLRASNIKICQELRELRGVKEIDNEDEDEDEDEGNDDE